jgi:hypothetical protein
MEPLKQINTLDIKINTLRLDLIKIIADINRMVSTNNVKARAAEYDALKKKYYDTNQEMEKLSAEKKQIQLTGATERQQAA